MTDEVVAIFGIQDEQNPPNDVDIIAEKHKQYEAARRLIFSLVSSRGGRLIGQLHGDEIVTIPVDQADVIKELHKRLQEECAIRATIGVGEDSEQAITALAFAKEKAPATIKVFDPDMNQTEEKIKTLDVAVGEGDRVQKSQKYIPVSQEDKVKIANILQIVQKNKPVFDQLMQQAPDVYASITSVVQSLTNILKQDRQAQDEHIAKMIAKINQHLDRHHQRKEQKHAKEIQKEIDKEADTHTKKRKEENSRLMDSARSMRKIKLESAKAHAEEHGHSNPKFFYHLLRAFEK